MANNVVPFIPRQRPRVEASAHLPGVDAAQAKNPGAVGGDHETPERDLTMAPGALASMRRILRLQCGSCRWEWQAPAIGACPRCRETLTIALTERHCVLPRA